MNGIQNLTGNRKILTVSQLTDIISEMLYDEIGVAYVQGEISNYKLHSSGHRYFTLKDEYAQINCVLWRSKILNFDLRDGMNVVVAGPITVYATRGQYQIDCEEIFPIGIGDLYLRFEALKKKLESEGLFDEEHKKPLPEFPLNIGIATSPTGAAIQDMFTTIRRRNPLCTIYFRETLVQGNDAKFDIVRAIEELNQYSLDLIIVGRGGGSLEDLWAFNEEEVARAIFASKIPIISAVGHETDFTIADFVADRRAATPTAAAEIATPITVQQLKVDVDFMLEQIENVVTSSIQNFKELIHNIFVSYRFRKIEDKVHFFRQSLDELTERLSNSTMRKFDILFENVDAISKHLASLHPLSPLKKGFVILKYRDAIISNAVSLSKFKKIEIHRADEDAGVKIEWVKPRLLN